MGDYRSSPHVNWRCKYHIVWTPKYRYKILKDKVGMKLYRSIYILCNMKDCEVLELNVQPDLNLKTQSLRQNPKASYSQGFVANCHI